MKIINMFRVVIPAPQHFLPNHNPNLCDEHPFNACIFRQITVSNDLTGNLRSLRKKVNN